jgi:hypothetical protein
MLKRKYRLRREFFYFLFTKRAKNEVNKGKITWYYMDATRIREVRGKG